jgi:hypothetical protein
MADEGLLHYVLKRCPSQPADIILDFRTTEVFMAGLAHFSFGFAAKRLAPKVPLAVLLIACGALDFICLGLMIFGLDPGAYLTHSLVMAAVWSLAGFGITAFISRSLRASAVVGSLVFSHWLLDAITWPMTAVNPTMTNGMPLAFQGSPTIGLGLYRTVFGVIFGEGLMLAAGIVIYIFTLLKIKRDKKAMTAGRLMKDAAS